LIAPSVIWVLIAAISSSGTGVGRFPRSPPRKPVIFGVFLTR